MQLGHYGTQSVIYPANIRYTKDRICRHITVILVPVRHNATLWMDSAFAGDLRV